MSAIRLGTIEGRHPLPVEDYLLQGPVVPGQAAYDAAFRAGRQWRREHPHAGVDLYYTGLTEVTLGCLDGLYYDAHGPQVVLWRWDADSESYVMLGRGPDAQAAMADWMDVHG